jgi:hypothetical protein
VYGKGEYETDDENNKIGSRLQMEGQESGNLPQQEKKCRNEGKIKYNVQKKGQIVLTCMFLPDTI